MCPPQAFSDYPPNLIPNLHHLLSAWRQSYCLPYSLLYPQHLEQCLANCWCWIKDCRMNKWESECRTLKQEKDVATRRRDDIAGSLQVWVKEKKSIHDIFIDYLFQQPDIRVLFFTTLVLQITLSVALCDKCYHRACAESGTFGPE